MASSTKKAGVLTNRLALGGVVWRRNNLHLILIGMRELPLRKSPTLGLPLFSLFVQDINGGVTVIVVIGVLRFVWHNWGIQIILHVPLNL